MERLIFNSQDKVTIEIQKLQINYTNKKTTYFEDNFGEQMISKHSLIDKKN